MSHPSYYDERAHSTEINIVGLCEKHIEFIV